MGWIWTIAIAALLLVAVMSSRIRLKVYLSREAVDDQLKLDCRILFGLIRYKYEVPTIRFLGLLDGIKLHSEHVEKHLNLLLNGTVDHVTPERATDFYKKSKRFLKRVVGFNKWLRSTLAHVHCSELRWATVIGLGDAVDTAVSIGAAWGLKTSLVGFASRYIKLESRPSLSVQPRYNRTVFAMKLRAKFHVRLGYVLYAGARMGLRYWRGKRAEKKQRRRMESEPAT